MKINKIATGEGFSYADDPQGSAGWLKNRIGIATASRLGDLMAVSKRDGKPLKACADYLQELAYERRFGVSYEVFVSGAMREGTEQEEAIADQYSSHMGAVVEKAGFFYNDVFGASPDRLVGDEGLLECKKLYDNNFAIVLATNLPLEAHRLQIQGQLWATGRKWCDYVAANANTGKMKVIRVERDEETIAEIKKAVEVVRTLQPLEVDTEGLFDYNPITQGEYTDVIFN